MFIFSFAHEHWIKHYTFKLVARGVKNVRTVKRNRALEK